MCLLKVANQRGSGEYVRFPAQDSGGGGDELERDAQEGPLEISQTQEMYQPIHPVDMTVPEPMFSDNSRAREMSAMVTALRHVVSGQRGGVWGQGTGLSGAASSSFGGLYSTSPSPPPMSAYSSSYTSPSPPLSALSSSSGSAFASASGSSSWAGQKRGREEEGVSQLIESIPRGYIPVADFGLSQGDSASGATG